MTYDLTDVNVLKNLLSRHGFTFSKALGQNFITDPAVCPKMAELSGITGDDCAIEIGPGVGVLTTELAKRAKKVVSIELDRRLLPVLARTLEEYRNAEVVCADVLKTDLRELVKEHFAPGDRVFVCANLPYYVTSPILMHLLESGVPFAGLTLMVQKEAGQRLTAPIGSRDAGAVTYAVQYYAESRMLFEVGRSSYTPAPQVDSCVVQLTPRDKPPVEVADEAFFFRTVKAAFSQRRKTAANGLSSGLGLPKDKVAEALVAAGLSPSVRAEALTMEEMAGLADKLRGKGPEARGQGPGNGPAD
ncbi:MAG: 16S rRNA (adenine(1518)-N(6)/adenine(1519)-N(6))-dimethyltransferase RsmA [Clostridia bacterium]|nr:16S rRNA (adenine(1518)-N(6)/adenine(1519)-N(6))-dimethyltransferase RsmA [Clostridia bacterium]